MTHYPYILFNLDYAHYRPRATFDVASSTC